MLSALEQLTGGYESECDRVRYDFGIAESQLRAFRPVRKSLLREAYLSDLTELRDQLKAKLSAHGHESGEDRGPAASELAKRIKAIKGANTIETTPQSVHGRQVAVAEEPITARVRRRREQTKVAGDDFPPRGAPAEPKASTFQKRILRERQQRTEGEGRSPPYQRGKEETPVRIHLRLR